MVRCHRAVVSASSRCSALLRLLPPALLGCLDTVTLVLPDTGRAEVEAALQRLYLDRNCSLLEQVITGEPDPASPQYKESSILNINLIVHDSFEACEELAPVMDNVLSGQTLFGNDLANNKIENIVEPSGNNNSNGKIACDICGVFVTKLKEHMIRKHPEHLHNSDLILHKCDVCDYSTRIKSTLKQHIYNMHAEKNIQCEQCSYKTALPAKLKQHMKKVHGSPTINCSFQGCKRRFVQECDLREHIKRVHPTGLFNCHICGKVFVNEDKMKRHIRMHNIDAEGLPCDKCHLKFLTKQKLREHMNTHTGATPFKCLGAGCGKSFMSSSSLAHHKKVCPGLNQTNEPLLLN